MVIIMVQIIDLFRNTILIKISLFLLYYCWLFLYVGDISSLCHVANEKHIRKRFTAKVKNIGVTSYVILSIFIPFKCPRF